MSGRRRRRRKQPAQITRRSETTLARVVSYADVTKAVAGALLAVLMLVAKACS